MAIVKTLKSQIFVIFWDSGVIFSVISNDLLRLMPYFNASEAKLFGNSHEITPVELWPAKNGILNSIYTANAQKCTLFLEIFYYINFSKLDHYK